MKYIGDKLPGYALVLPDTAGFGVKGKTLGEKVWEELRDITADFSLVKASPVTRFSDSSFKLELDGSVRNKQVYVFISPDMQASEQVMMTAQIIDASRRANADRNGINLMETYNPWYTQDKRDVGHRESVSGQLVADLYNAAGLTHIFYFEPHSQIALDGWYKSVDPIFMSAFHASEIAEEFELTSAVVGIPDDGSTKRSEFLAKALGVPRVKIGKTRQHDRPEEAEAIPVAQDLQGRTVILYDDMIRTGRTAVSTSKAAKEAGASRVIYVATHLGIYKPEDLFGSPYIDAIRGTSTIRGHPTHEKLREYDISRFAAEIINRKSHGMDVSEFIVRMAPTYSRTRKHS